MTEKKEYRSAIRSRRFIRQAFMELLKEKKFEKITVTDIVNRADINRSTFYAHYPDVRGLVEDILDEVVRKSTQLIREMNYQSIFEDPRPFLRELLFIGMDNVEIYKRIGGTDFALRQIEELKTSLMDKAVSDVDVPEVIRMSNAYKIQINFFIGGILNTYQQWLQGNLVCTTEEIMEQIARVIQNNADMYLGWGEGKIQ